MNRRETKAANEDTMTYALGVLEPPTHDADRAALEQWLSEVEASGDPAAGGPLVACAQRSVARRLARIERG